MRNCFILLLLFTVFIKAQTQIDQIPGIVIQNDFDFEEASKPIQFFYDDYVLINSYQEYQLWLTDGNDTNTKLLLDYKKLGNIEKIQVVGNTAFVFVHLKRDSLLSIFRIQNNRIDLDTISMIKGQVRDFNILNNKIYFTELDFAFGFFLSYYYYDISNKTVNKILNTTKALLSTPFVWKNELYYIGSVSGNPGTSLVKYLENSDSIETITMLDSAYTFLDSKQVIQDEDLFYLFIPFVKLPSNEYHSFLMRSDGTQNGTYKLKEMRGPSDQSENEAIIWKDHLYFNGFDQNDSIGYELYVSDGTTTGTHVLKDLEPGKESFYPGNFTAFKNKLVFNSSQNAGYYLLRISDGTAIGTKSFGNQFRFTLGPISVMDDTLIICGSNDFVQSIGNEIFFYADDTNIRYFDINQGNGNDGHSRLYQSLVTPHHVYFVVNDGSGFIHPYVYKRNDLTNGTHDKPNDHNLFLFPNPVKDVLHFDQRIDLREVSKISLIAENGIEMKVDSWNDNKINLKNLLPGFYKILIYQKDKLKYSGSFSKVK